MRSINFTLLDSILTARPGPVGVLLEFLRDNLAGALENLDEILSEGYVLAGEETEGIALGACSTGSPDAMDVVLSCRREVEVDHTADIFHVYTNS